jgi:hypothetical protein
MKRYTWQRDEHGRWFYTLDRGTPILDDTAYQKHEMVLASDVAELERRYREAVRLLTVAYAWVPVKSEASPIISDFLAKEGKHER